MVFIKQRKNNEAKIAAKLQQNGWDKAALQVYDKAYAKRIAKGKPMEAWTETSRLIGSELYTKMFKAARLSPPQQKLTLVLQQLQAQVDRNGFLQVGTIYSLDPPQMAPHAAFCSTSENLCNKFSGNGVLENMPMALMDLQSLLKNYIFSEAILIGIILGLSEPTLWARMILKNYCSMPNTINLS